MEAFSKYLPSASVASSLSASIALEVFFSEGSTVFKLFAVLCKSDNENAGFFDIYKLWNISNYENILQSSKYSIIQYTVIEIMNKIKFKNWHWLSVNGIKWNG